MRSSMFLSAALAACFAFTGCNEKTSEGGEGDKPAAEKAAEPKVVKKTLDTLFTGTSPTLPSPFKGLKAGMTKDEAVKVQPKLAEGRNLKPVEYEGTWFTVDIDKKTNIIERFYFDLPKAEAEGMISKPWGPGIKGQTSLGKPMLFWFNPETGLRVTLKDGYGDEKSVEFTAYNAAAKLVGADKAKKSFAFEDKAPILGASADDMRKNYKDFLVEKNLEQAKADRKKLEAMAGKKVKMLGAPKPSMHLELPPTEYESYWTRVHLTFDDENKVRRYWFKLAFDRNPAAKDELFGLLKTKFGEPKTAEKYGDKIFIFSEAEPYIEVKEDTISKGWDVSVDVKK